MNFKKMNAAGLVIASALALVGPSIASAKDRDYRNDNNSYSNGRYEQSYQPSARERRAIEHDRHEREERLRRERKERERYERSHRYQDNGYYDGYRY